MEPPLDDMSSFLLGCFLDVENQPRFYIFNDIGVVLKVVVEFKSLVEPFVDRVLDKSFALLGRGSRDIHHHIRVGILKYDTASNSCCLLRNGERPKDLLRTWLPLPELQHPIRVSIQIATGPFLLRYHKYILIFVAFGPFNPEELSWFPVPVGEFDFLGKVLDDKGRKGMHYFIAAFFVNVLDHPYLVEVFVAGNPNCRHLIPIVFWL